MLGDGVGHRFERGDQPGGGNGLQQVAFAALHHLRKHGAGGVDVRQNVNIAHAGEVGVADVDIGGGEDSGVGAEQVDVVEAGDGFRYQPLDLGFLGNVD